MTCAASPPALRSNTLSWLPTAAATAPVALALAHVAAVVPDSPRWLALSVATHARGDGRRARGRGDPTAGLSDLSGDEKNASAPPAFLEGVAAARQALTVLHCTQPSRRSALEIFWRGFPEVVPGARQRAALDRELELTLKHISEPTTPT